MFQRTVRASFAVLLLGGVACGIPVIPFNLTPVPRAGDGPSPVKAQVRRVAVTPDLLATGARPESESRLVIEIDVHNADPQRAFELGVPMVRLQDALGGPVMAAGLVVVQWNGLRAMVPSDESPVPPPPVEQQPPMNLGPGETRTFTAVYDRLAVTGAGGPLSVVVSIPVAGQPPLELVLAAPADGRVRWENPAHEGAVYVGSGVSLLSGGISSNLIEPLSITDRFSFGGLVLDANVRLGVLYRDALASGPLALTSSGGIGVGWNFRRLPFGIYASGGLLLASEYPPDAYRRASGDNGRTLVLPRMAVGLVIHDGARLAGPSLLPTHRPPLRLRRLAMRVGYARFFNTDDRFGTGALDLALELAFSP